MQSTIVRGSFIMENGDPVAGVIEFIPTALWIWKKGQAYATLAPCVELDQSRFEVELTPTDYGPVRWRYTVLTPAGKFQIEVPMIGREPQYLKHLIEKSKTK